MIHFDQVEFQYPHGEFHLRIPNLEIESGRHVAVVGPSGSGKTTLLHLVAGIYVPTAGGIHVGEVTISSLPDSARRNFRIQQVGFVFQDFELLEYLSVHENVVLPYLINNSLKLDRHVWQTAKELATSLGIGGYLRRGVQQLSQGERQRVAICRALLTNPNILLADEPTGNLDPANKHKIMELLHQSAREHDATLVVVTHDRDLLDEFDEVVDFVRFMSDD